MTVDGSGLFKVWSGHEPGTQIEFREIVGRPADDGILTIAIQMITQDRLVAEIRLGEQEWVDLLSSFAKLTGQLWPDGDRWLWRPVAAREPQPTTDRPFLSD